MTFAKHCLTHYETSSEKVKNRFKRQHHKKDIQINVTELKL